MTGNRGVLSSVVCGVVVGVCRTRVTNVLSSCFTKMSDEVESEENFNDDANAFNRRERDDNRFREDEEYEDDRDEFRFRKRMRGGFR